ncbi:unnamed protein product [Diabrotica balteata]|uniref:Uncharacterized protein n=1 Tax=Diabrotica balteata TaxID=107213 RepID=A0A9N9TAC8_DIABA|nr:unnamed protein product [Diabrotica balteata]
MNTTLNPVTSQASSATPNKPMHPQGAPVSYGQPSGPITQNPYPNTNMAHNHPPSQQNHYSLGGSSPFNMGAIPASNHPLANNQSSSGQVYNAPKNVSYSSGFQNAQNQNTLPPVVQTLPATNPTASTPQGVPSSQNLSNSNSNSNSTVQGKEPSVEKERPQSNGTTEEEPSRSVEEKPEPQENHVIPESSNTTETSEVQEPPREPPQETPEELTTEKPKSPEPTQQEAETAQQSSEDKVEEAASVSPSVSDSVQDAESIPDPAQAPSPSIAEPAESVTRPITPPTSVTEPAKSATPVTPQKETPDPETVQSDKVAEESEKAKDAPEIDPLADPLETAAADKSAQEKDEVEAENKEESEDNEGEDQLNEEATEAENVQKDEDPLAKTPPKTPARKTKAVKQEAKTETKTPQKSPATGKTKRQRMMTQHYQSPLPEIEIITKISSSTPRSKNNDDKLIYFYKNEFLAVRNSEGGFYLCQAIQNVYKSSSKIKIRWLSQDKNDKSGEIYTPDFYDLTDFDCILTSLDLTKVGKGRYKLKPKEKERTDSILKRCLAVEKGEISQPSVSEEHPDGLDLSLYKDEEQLVKKKSPVKRKAPPRSESPKKETPTKKTPETPKVRKVEPKPSRTTTPAKKQTPAKKIPEPKKTPASSRSARGKRKSEPKTSPVVDQKKAKVLAKIGRKSAVSSSSPKPQPQSTPKSAKSPKPTPSTSKATKPAPASSKPPPRKTKRSTRK